MFFLASTVKATSSVTLTFYAFLNQIDAGTFQGKVMKAISRVKYNPSSPEVNNTIVLFPLFPIYNNELFGACYNPIGNPLAVRAEERAGGKDAIVLFPLFSIYDNEPFITCSGPVGNPLTVRAEDRVSYTIVSLPLFSINDDE